MKKKLELFLGLSILLMLSSCTVKKVASSEDLDYQTLIVNKWVLRDNNETLKNYSGEDISLAFKMNEGQQAFGFASCNNYKADISQIDDSGNLVFGLFSATKRYCPDMKIETNYLDMLGHVNRYAIVNGNLFLYKDQLLLLTFNPLIE